MRFFFIFLLFFNLMFCYDLKPIKNYKPEIGDIFFYYDNRYVIDQVLNAYLRRNVTHTALALDSQRAVGFSIYFIGSKGFIEYDEIKSDILEPAKGIIILRPKFYNGYAYKRYRSCIKRNIKRMIEQFKEKKYDFDWFYRPKSKNYRCTTWVKHIVEQCLPKSYFSNVKKRFPLFEAYNLNKFIIWVKNVKIKKGEENDK